MMLRVQLFLVGLLMGALILAGLGNKNLRDQLNRATRSLQIANKTETDLRTCKMNNGEQKLLVTRMQSEKHELQTKFTAMEKEMATLKLKAASIPNKDKEIATLKTQIQEAQKRETDLKKKIQEAEKALDSMAKEEEARKVKEAKGNKNTTKTPEKKKQ